MRVSRHSLPRARQCLRLAFFALAAVLPAALQAQPSNNNFSAAQILSGLSGSVTGTNVGATKEAGEPNHGGEAGGASVWYAWEAPASGAAEFDLDAIGFDVAMSAYTGAVVNALQPLAQNDDEFEYLPLVSKWFFRGTQSRIRFPAQAGTRYVIAVDGSGGAAGSFRLNWNLKPRPANDQFTNALALDGADGFLVTHNVGATREAGEPNHAANPGSASIWFRWTAPVSGTTRFHTLNSLTSLAGPLDTLLAVYTGNSPGGLTQIAANDNNGSSLRSLVQFAAVAGTTYRIAVDTKAAGTNHGHLLLTWAGGTPANNQFAGAQLLNGACGFVQGHNTSASRETGEPMIAGNPGGASIWYSWTAPADGAVMFTTLGSPFLDTLLGVYTGATVNALTLVEQNDDLTGGFLDGLSYSRVEFIATAGTTYRVSIDGYNSGSGAANGVTFLHWAQEPALNDNILNAQALSGASGVVTGCNAFATLEPDEPAHGGNDGGRSLWYHWQAPTSGVATLDLAGSHFDTLVAVYRADEVPSVNALTLVAQNDDLPADFDITFHSRVEFPATAGATYHIAVDGADDGSGYVSDGWLVMHYHLAPLPVLQFVRSGNNLVIQWNGPYVLESTPALPSPGSGMNDWTSVPGVSPVTVPIDPAGNRFFRAAFR
jgi:hypothetical protein